jgi:signal peptide peptidase SppA
MNHYEAISRAVRSQLWAIQPDKLEAIMAFLALKQEGKDADAKVVAEIHGASEVQAARARKVTSSTPGSVVVLPVYGLILHRGSSMGDISGPAATSTTRLLSQFKQAMSDPNVKAIIFDVDSPGGTVEGVDELATEIRAARGKKQTIAVSNKQCASAAYYIASACDEIVASPSSMTGSIGVYCAHEDASLYLEKQGVKVSLIKFGENKAEGNPYEPLSDNARAHMQDTVDLFGVMFERAVAKGRKTTQGNVHKTFGQGLMFGAAKAVELGMADSIGTLDDVLARFGLSQESQSSSMRGSSTFRERLDSQSAVKSEAKADDAADCECPCDGCSDGDCTDCTTDDCSFDGCTCDAAQAVAKKRADVAVARASMRRKVVIAAL